MVDLESYISQPCRMLSIPYWKSKNIILPDDILIVHDENFNEEYLNEYTNEEYFRIYHPLQVVEETIPEWLLFKTVEEDDMNTVVSIINDSYSDLSVNITQMIGYTQLRVYNRDLWIIVYDKHSMEPIGCGIADYDDETKEGILEWIQVVPGFRKKGVGTAIVNQLLYRLSLTADFATVSGKVKMKLNRKDCIANVALSAMIFGTHTEKINQFIKICGYSKEFII